MDRPGYTRQGPRKLIGLLLAINLGVFLAGMALQHWSPAARAPLVYNADKIQLLAVPTGSGAQSVGKPAAQSETRVASNPRCLRWSALDAEGLAAIEARLRQLGIAANAYDIALENELEIKLGWWVFLPPRENKAALQAMIDEVRRLGITDYAPVKGGPMRNALALGAFANLAQTQERAAGLVRKGVKDVKFGPRPETGAVRLVFSGRLADSALPNIEGWPDGLQPARCAPP